jgi:hypothetical protein
VNENNAHRCSSTGSLVYFDTSVFDPRDGVSEADESLVLDAIYSQRFRLVFDLDCFFEPLLAFRGLARNEVPRAALQLERILKWCDRRRAVNSAQNLLTQAVLSYVGHPDRPEEFLIGKREFDSEIAKWDRDRSPKTAFWQEVAHSLQSEREHFEESFTQLLRQLGPRDGFKPGG